MPLVRTCVLCVPLVRVCVLCVPLVCVYVLYAPLVHPCVSMAGAVILLCVPLVCAYICVLYAPLVHPCVSMASAVILLCVPLVCAYVCVLYAPLVHPCVSMAGAVILLCVPLVCAYVYSSSNSGCQVFGVHEALRACTCLQTLMWHTHTYACTSAQTRAHVPLQAASQSVASTVKRLEKGFAEERAALLAVGGRALAVSAQPLALC